MFSFRFIVLKCLFWDNTMENLDIPAPAVLPTLITEDIFSASLACETKSYLKAAGAPGYVPIAAQMNTLLARCPCQSSTRVNIAS
jgi:hypothetical protein